MSPQLKQILISDKPDAFISLKEQVLFQNGQEGKRVWEAGITIARYIYYNPDQFKGKVILELGSGTGIGGLAALKFTECSRVIMTDYTQEVLSLIKDNAKLLKSTKTNPEIFLVDWTKQETYEELLGEHIDIIIATDVIYHGSPYNSLAKLMHTMAVKDHNIDIKLIIPKQRDCKHDFLQIMQTYKFEHTETELEGPHYRYRAIESEKESDKYYPGLKKLNFDLFTFKLNTNID